MRIKGDGMKGSRLRGGKGGRVQGEGAQLCSKGSLHPRSVQRRAFRLPPRAWAKLRGKQSSFEFALGRTSQSLSLSSSSQEAAVGCAYCEGFRAEHRRRARSLSPQCDPPGGAAV